MEHLEKLKNEIISLKASFEKSLDHTEKISIKREYLKKEFCIIRKT